MFSHIDDITIDYEEDGVLLVKELDKAVLSRGAWTTIIFRYRQWEQAKEDYGPVRFTIRRYRKINEEYRQQARFNISSEDQARKIVEALRGWMEEGASPSRKG